MNDPTECGGIFGPSHKENEHSFQLSNEGLNESSSVHDPHLEIVRTQRLRMCGSGRGIIWYTIIRILYNIVGFLGGGGLVCMYSGAISMAMYPAISIVSYL